MWVWSCLFVFICVLPCEKFCLSVCCLFVCLSVFSSVCLQLFICVIVFANFCTLGDELSWAFAFLEPVTVLFTDCCCSVCYLQSWLKNWVINWLRRFLVETNDWNYVNSETVRRSEFISWTSGSELQRCLGNSVRWRIHWRCSFCCLSIS